MKKSLDRMLEPSIANGLKGIGAICVMLGHYSSALANMGKWSYFSYLFPGYLWVGMFFLFSGYGLQVSFEHKKKYLKHFLKNKIVTILIPFLLAEAVYICVDELLLASQDGGIDIVGALWPIRLHNSILWYVIHLLVVAFLFWGIYRTVRWKHKQLLWIPLYLIYVVVMMRLDVGTWWYLSTGVMVLGFLMTTPWVNALVHRVTDGVLGKSILLILFIGCYAMIFVLAEDIWAPGGVPVNLAITALQMICGFLFLIIPILLANLKPIKAKVTKYLGTISYEIYLYHIPVQMAFGRLPIGNIGVKIAGQVVATLVVAAIMNVIHRQIKALFVK